MDGTVEGIGLRSTRVRNLDGHLVTILNKTMGNEIITNITHRPTIKTELNIGLTYGTPAEKVKRATLVLEEIFRSTPRTTDLIISFHKFGDSALNIFYRPGLERHGHQGAFRCDAGTKPEDQGAVRRGEDRVRVSNPDRLSQTG